MLHIGGAIILPSSDEWNSWDAALHGPEAGHFPLWREDSAAATRGFPRRLEVKSGSGRGFWEVVFGGCW
jgi:hypothetical protein